MLKRLVGALAMLLLCIVTNAQSPQGVSIAEDSLAPDVSAILDVRSINKGVLLPRMTFAEMLVLGNKDNGNTADGFELPTGTTVFVTVVETEDWQQQQKRGLYYWHNSITSDPETQKWKKLEIKRVQYPVGSVLMYSVQATDVDGSGKLNCFTTDGMGTGKMTGWALCNGNFGTPDLRGRFVVGGDADSDDYKKLFGVSSGKGGDNFHTEKNFTDKKIPSHTHKIDLKYKNKIAAKHTHKFYNKPHYHNLFTTHKAGNNAGFDRTAIRNAGRKKVKDFTEGDGSLYPATADLKVSGDPVVVPPALPNFVQKTGGGKSIENRPPFYTGIYIMRIETDAPKILVGNGDGVDVLKPLKTPTGGCN